MKIKELIEKATEALHGAIKGERRPRPIIFDSIKDLSNALIRAKEAHSEFERGLRCERLQLAVVVCRLHSNGARGGGKVGVQTRQLRNRSFARFRKCAA